MSHNPNMFRPPHDDNAVLRALALALLILAILAAASLIGGAWR